MVTISQAVRDIIARSPFLADALSEGVANVTEVARQIQPRVEERLYESVTTEAVAMALRRVANTRRPPQFGARFLKELRDVTVRAKLVEFVFTNTLDVLQAVRPLLEQMQENKEAFFYYAQGLHESVIVCSQEVASDVRARLQKHTVQQIDGLSMVTMRLPQTSLAVPGVYYPVLKAIAQAGISFVEILSVNTEFSILFADEDIDRAFAAIRQMAA